MSTSDNASNTGPSIRMVITVFVILSVVAGLLTLLIFNLPAPVLNEQTAPPALPSLQPDDVIANLTSNRFGCTSAESRGLYVLWTCEQRNEFFQFKVILYGETPERLDYIVAHAYNIATSETTMRQFFHFVSAFPYEGASPSQAKGWVNQVFVDGSQQTITIGDVPFVIEGTAVHRTLTMGQFRWADAPFFVEDGLNHFQQGNFVGTVESSNQALALDPLSASAYFLRARAYDEQEVADQAVADYIKVLELSDDPDLQQQVRAFLAALR